MLALLSCTKDTKPQIVEAACGQCQFNMTEISGCDLAVRMNGKSYFVDNTNIDDHGDAHADDGFCNTVRTARVKGKIVEGRFKVELFELIKKEEMSEITEEQKMCHYMGI